MHKVQAKILAEIVDYLLGKCGDEPELVELTEDQDNFLHITLTILIGRDYPGIPIPEEAEQCGHL
jgi:hypothetical protein